MYKKYKCGWFLGENQAWLSIDIIMCITFVEARNTGLKYGLDLSRWLLTGMKTYLVGGAFTYLEGERKHLFI